MRGGLRGHTSTWQSSCWCDLRGPSPTARHGDWDPRQHPDPPSAGAAARPHPTAPAPHSRQGDRNTSTTRGAVPGPWHLRSLRPGEPRRAAAVCQVADRLPSWPRSPRRDGVRLAPGSAGADTMLCGRSLLPPVRPHWALGTCCSATSHHVQPRPTMCCRVLPCPSARGTRWPHARERTWLFRHRCALHGGLQRWRQQTCVTARAASGSSHFPLELGHHAMISATASTASRWTDGRQPGPARPGPTHGCPGMIAAAAAPQPVLGAGGSGAAGGCGRRLVG